MRTSHLRSLAEKHSLPLVAILGRTLRVTCGPPMGPVPEGGEPPFDSALDNYE